jgi:hypothetical protein
LPASVRHMFARAGVAAAIARNAQAKSVDLMECSLSCEPTYPRWAPNRPSWQAPYYGTFPAATVKRPAGRAAVTVQGQPNRVDTGQIGLAKGRPHPLREQTSEGRFPPKPELPLPIVDTR